VELKHSLLVLLADPIHSPLAHENRLVRETGAQLAATLLAECNQALSAARSKLITLFTADIENMASRALLSDPAQPDEIMTPSRNALEGIFYTFLELVRRGDALAVEHSIPLILRAALRTAESKDKDFAMVSKLTIAYLKYLNVERAELRAFTEILCETMHDENWHTRAATLRYIQALIYHHAFTIDLDLFAMLRECVVEALHDKQLEVAQLASHTLMIFFKGVGAADESTLRDRFLKIVSTRLPSDVNSELIMRKHAAVLGLSACVLSNPYEVPSWMPEVMEALGFASLEPSPIKQATQRTFAEFKKTHQDTWSQTRAAFTHEQWENASLGLELAPSYII
jgi:proteasome activator subunit 4